MKVELLTVVAALGVSAYFLTTRDIRAAFLGLWGILAAILGTFLSRFAA
jgi:hypothetical protein